LIVDCHAHIEDEAFGEGVAAVMERAREAGVEIVINPGYDVRSSLIAAENAATHRGLYAMAGIHPHDAAGVGDDELEEISKILSMPRVVGIGEIGLDYYRDFSPRDEQVRVFRAQLELAKASGCPVQIHSRDANLETFNILKEYAQDLPAIVLHCYSGSAEMAADLIKLGFFISLGGPSHTGMPGACGGGTRCPPRQASCGNGFSLSSPKPAQGRAERACVCSGSRQKIAT